MVKALILLLLATVVFGGAWIATDALYLQPKKALEAEKQRGPEPPPPDPTVPEFDAALRARQSGGLLAGRAALEEFLARYPESTKADAARDALGEINVDLFFSQAPAPEKVTYLVKRGDVLTRVAMRTKTTPELMVRSNNLSSTMLKIGQKLTVTPADFSAVINLKRKRVTLYNGKKFFKQYFIHAFPTATASKKGAPAPPRRLGKVVDKIATDENGNRVTFQDKAYATATHKVSLSIPGHSLYSLPKEGAPAAATSTQNGIGLLPEDVAEIAVLLSKNDPVTIE